MKTVVSIVGVLGLITSVAYAHHVSDHVVDDIELTKGHARLIVSRSGPSIEIELYTPTINVLSFDAEPENEAQRVELDQALAWLGDANKVFSLSDDASCAPVVTELNSSIIDGSGIPDNSKFHEFDGYYIFECKNAEKLDQIKVELFDAYPAHKEVFTKVQGQGKTKRGKLLPASTVLKLS